MIPTTSSPMSLAHNRWYHQLEMTLQVVMLHQLHLPRHLLILSRLPMLFPLQCYPNHHPQEMMFSSRTKVVVTMLNPSRKVNNGIPGTYPSFMSHIPMTSKTLPTRHMYPTLWTTMHVYCLSNSKSMHSVYSYLPSRNPAYYLYYVSMTEFQSKRNLSNPNPNG